MLENVKDNESKQLLLVTLDGHVYGIWEDAVLAIEDLRTVHHLPVSLPHIAGVSIRNDHAITLADLAVCLGHAAMEKRVAGHLLIMSDNEKIAGFAVEGELRRAFISPQAVHTMPEFLRTEVVDSCVAVESIPVPVINIAALYKNVQHLEYQPTAPPCILPRPSQVSENVERIRTFSIGNAFFGASAESLEERAQTPTQITPLALVPGFVKGLELYLGRVMTVIDLESRVLGEESESKAQMLVAEIRGALFGFLINADRGPLEKEDYSVKPLPPIAQSSWLRSSIEHAGEILPLIDLDALLSCRQAGEDEKPLPERYAPDMGFLSFFGKQDTDVVEFSLLGHRHALPRSEVKDNIGFKPYRTIPNVPEIVIGVAEDSGALLPVLDLAMVYGRRSLVTREWRMLRIENGDFLALVITEAVYAERRLPLKIQREVPIKLPYAVVYGCYPDAESVRLILNVEALTVYFEKALVQELVPSMTPEMKQARAEIVPSLLGELLHSSEYTMAAKEPVAPQESLPTAPVLQPPETPGVQSTPGSEGEPEPIAAVAASLETTEPMQLEEQAALPGVSQEPSAVAGHEKTAPEDQEEEVVQSEIEGPQHSVEPTFAQEEERIPEAVAEQPADELHEPVEPLPAAAASGEDTTEGPFREELLPPQADTGAVEGPLVPVLPEVLQKPEPELRPTVGEKKPDSIAAAPVEQEQASPVTVRILYHQETQPLHHEQVEEQSIIPQAQEEEAPVPGKKWRAWLGVAAAIVLGVFLWQMDSMQKKKLGQAKKPVVEEKQQAQKREREPLVLLVPADVKIEIDKYIVKQGDTLWDISKRFTGNPFNYPGIAGENRIPDPDLIYPEQKIIIKKKEK